jgi:hypothetical protein
VLVTVFQGAKLNMSISERTLEARKFQSHHAEHSSAPYGNLYWTRKYSFSYHVHEKGNVPAAMRDRWTEGEVIFVNSRWRILDVTVLVSTRRNNILEHLALRNAPTVAGNLQLATGCLVLLTRVVSLCLYTRAYR